MSPENGWLEDVFPIEIVPFLRGHVSFQGCTFFSRPRILGSLTNETPFTKKLARGERLSCGIFLGVFSGLVVVSPDRSE